MFSGLVVIGKKTVGSSILLTNLSGFVKAGKGSAQLGIGKYYLKFLDGHGTFLGSFAPGHFSIAGLTHSPRVLPTGAKT